METLVGLFITLGLIYGTAMFFVGIVAFCGVFLFVIGFVIYNLGEFIHEKLRKQNKVS